MLQLLFVKGGLPFLGVKRLSVLNAAFQSTQRVEYKPIKKVMVANRGNFKAVFSIALLCVPS